MRIEQTVCTLLSVTLGDFFFARRSCGLMEFMEFQNLNKMVF